MIGPRVSATSRGRGWKTSRECTCLGCDTAATCVCRVATDEREKFVGNLLPRLAATN